MRLVQIVMETEILFCKDELLGVGSMLEGREKTFVKEKQEVSPCCSNRPRDLGIVTPSSTTWYEKSVREEQRRANIPYEL